MHLIKLIEPCAFRTPAVLLQGLLMEYLCGSVCGVVINRTETY